MAQIFYCKYCGFSSGSVNSLTSGNCQYHPNGTYKGYHVLYEGSIKSSYTCKYCGQSSSHIASLTSGICQRHPNGIYKGHHEPAL